MYYTVIKHSSHLRTLEKCRKHSPAARAFHISLVFSNACRVLSQCNTRLRLLYLLNNNNNDNDNNNNDDDNDNDSDSDRGRDHDNDNNNSNNYNNYFSIGLK